MSIHIQDEVLDKIKPYKDMINVSKVCANALLKQVEIYTSIPKEVRNMQTLVLRLRKDMSAQKKECFNLGMAMARLYLKKISFKELNDWGTRSYSDNGSYYFPEEVEDKIEKYLLDEDSNINVFDRSAFIQGWSTIMTKTWESTKNKI